jgi:hypothetical protein
MAPAKSDVSVGIAEIGENEPHPHPSSRMRTFATAIGGRPRFCLGARAAGMMRGPNHASIKISVHYHAKSHFFPIEDELKRHGAGTDGANRIASNRVGTAPPRPWTSTMKYLIQAAVVIGAMLSVMSAAPGADLAVRPASAPYRASSHHVSLLRASTHRVASHRTSSHHAFSQRAPTPGVSHRRASSDYAVSPRTPAHSVSAHRASLRHASSQRVVRGSFDHVSSRHASSHHASSQRRSMHGAPAHRPSPYYASSPRGPTHGEYSIGPSPPRASPQPASTYRAVSSADRALPQSPLTSVSLPEPDLLRHQTVPDCEFKSAAEADRDAVLRLMKLDYESQCYRQSEFILRARMERLQDAVKKTLKSFR